MLKRQIDAFPDYKAKEFTKTVFACRGFGLSKNFSYYLWDESASRLLAVNGSKNSETPLPERHISAYFRKKRLF